MQTDPEDEKQVCSLNLSKSTIQKLRKIQASWLNEGSHVSLSALVDEILKAAISELEVNNEE